MSEKTSLSSEGYVSVAIQSKDPIMLPAGVFTRLDELYTSLCTSARAFMQNPDNQRIIGTIQAYAYMLTLHSLILPSQSFHKESFRILSEEDVYETPSLMEDPLIMHLQNELETRLTEHILPSPGRSDLLLEAVIDETGAYRFTLDALLTYPPPTPESTLSGILPLVNPFLLQEDRGMCSILLEHDQILLERHTAWEIRISYENREYVLIGKNLVQENEDHLISYDTDGRMNTRRADPQGRILLFTLEDATPAPQDPAGFAARLLRRIETGFSFTHLQS